MSEKTITIAATVIPKSLTEAEWSLESNKNYVPAAGEKVLYTRDESHNYVRVKYGDGENKVGDLLFADKYILDAIPKKLSQLTGDSNHRIVTDAEKTKWNAKLDEKDIADFVTTEQFENSIDPLENLLVSVENQESISYGISVPDNCLSYAKIDMIGGMTRKCTNLLDISTAEFQSINGGVASVSGDTLTVTGDIVAVHLYNLKAGAEYTIRTVSTRTGEAGGGVALMMLDDSGNAIQGIYQYQSTLSPTITFEVPENTAYVRIYFYGSGSSSDRTNSATFTNIMFNKGNALPYEPYFEGLRSAPVTEVKSIGKNFVDMERFYDANNWVASAGDKRCRLSLGVLPVGTYVISGFFNSTIGGYLYLRAREADGTYTEVAYLYQGGKQPLSRRILTLTRPLECELWSWWGNHPSLAECLNLYSDIQVKRGTTDTEYEPYKGSSLLVPEAVRGLDGYGLGAGTYGNSVDFATRKYTKSFDVVDLGTLQWHYGDFDGKKVFSTFDLEKLMKSGTRNVVSPIPFLNYADIWGNELDNVFFVNGTAIRGVFTQYTDVTSFKAAMSGVMLVYELAEPIITDISDILSTNCIPVEEGGTVTFINEYNYDVPNKINFYTTIEVPKVIGAKTIVGDLIGNASSAKVADSISGLTVSVEQINSIANLDFLANTLSGNVATGEKSVAFGKSTEATGDYSFAQGYSGSAQKTVASGFSSTALGEGVQAIGRNSLAQGEMTQALERGSHAEGKITKAYGMYTHAEGSETEAGFTDNTEKKLWGDQASHAEGYLSKAIDRYTHAEGYKTHAGYDPEVQRPMVDLEGNNYPNYDVASAAHAEGYETNAFGFASHAEGRGTYARTSQAHAEGEGADALGHSSHAEGYRTKTEGKYSHAEGRETVASGEGSHTEGIRNKATNNGAHAEGADTQATGNRAHAEGQNTIAEGESSHAEGARTAAVGACSHAEGADTQANGRRAHAEGEGTVAQSDYQHVQGKFNVVDNDGIYADIIGNGKSKDARSNAYTLDWDGNGTFSGGVVTPKLTLNDTEITRIATSKDYQNIYQYGTDDEKDTIIPTFGAVQNLISYMTCLMEGTPINMYDGTYKNIEDVQPGDIVKSYNPVTKEVVPAVAVYSLLTGANRDYKTYCFENGKFLTVYGKHGIYDQRAGNMCDIQGINDSVEVIAADGSVTHWTLTCPFVVAGKKRKRYTLITSNSLYFANDLLVGEKSYMKLDFCLDLGISLPEDIQQVWEQDAEDYNDYGFNILINPEFQKERADLLKTFRQATSELSKYKQLLSQSDYKSHKYAEGKLSEEEWLVSNEQRDKYRLAVNENEKILKTNEQERTKLWEKYRKLQSGKEIFEACCTRDNAIYDIVKNHFQNIQK